MRRGPAGDTHLLPSRVVSSSFTNRENLLTGTGLSTSFTSLASDGHGERWSWSPDGSKVWGARTLEITIGRNDSNTSINDTRAFAIASRIEWKKWKLQFVEVIIDWVLCRRRQEAGGWILGWVLRRRCRGAGSWILAWVLCMRCWWTERMRVLGAWIAW